MSRKKRTKADNITMRGVKVKNSPILICPECARRYIQTELDQIKCLFCIRKRADFSTWNDLQFDEENDIIDEERMVL